MFQNVISIRNKNIEVFYKKYVEIFHEKVFFSKKKFEVWVGQDRMPPASPGEGCRQTRPRVYKANRVYKASLALPMCACTHEMHIDAAPLLQLLRKLCH